MALFGRRDVDRANRQLSHAYRSRGHLEDISGFLCPDGIPGSFLLSGGADPEERYRPLRPVLETLVGRMPILILHSGRGPLRDMAVEAWQSYAPETPLWDIGSSSPSSAWRSPRRPRPCGSWLSAWATPPRPALTGWPGAIWTSWPASRCP